MKVHFKVSGNVQGVFFRHNTKKKAEDLGISGWIRNNADGTVEGEAFGEKDQLDKFIQWCKSGPKLAEVEKVVINWGQGARKVNGFEII